MVDKICACVNISFITSMCVYVGVFMYVCVCVHVYVGHFLFKGYKIHYPCFLYNSDHYKIMEHLIKVALEVHLRCAM